MCIYRSQRPTFLSQQEPECPSSHGSLFLMQYLEPKTKTDKYIAPLLIPEDKFSSIIFSEISHQCHSDLANRLTELL